MPYAVLPVGHCILSLSFLREVVSFIPIEDKQENPFQDWYKISSILYIKLHISYVFNFTGCYISANKQQADKVTNTKQVLWVTAVLFLPAASTANALPASN